MSNFKPLWVIRSERGQVRGPFETPVILKMIRDGSLSGDEKIARYPGGTWTAISLEPEFYDHLLGALEAEPQTPVKKDLGDETDFSEDTIISVPPQEALRAKIEKTSQPKPTAAPRSSPPKRSEAPPIIELTNLKKVEKDRKLEKAKMPFVALSVILLLVLLFLLWPSSGPKGKLHLIAPQKGDETLSADEIKKRTGQALADIQKDTVESYQAAENKLVSLIEGAPRYLPGRALLCEVYKELWPYTYQDQQDEKTLTEFSQATKNLNLIGIHGNICEAVKLMTLGRPREARGVVDNMLDNPDDISFLSVVYVIKGELLSYERDDANAIAFFKQAAEKGRGWIKPQNDLAFMYLRTRQYGNAVEEFKNVLKLNPAHKSAMLGMGITLYKGFNKSDEAYTWLKAAWDSTALAPGEIEGEGYFVLATIALQKDDKKLAQLAAAKAYERNPQNETVKELYLRLGGSDKDAGGSQKNELIFRGDQYFRQGDCLSAQAQYKTAFELDPKNGTAAMKAAKCLWTLHQSFEAIEWLRKAIQAEPTLTSAYVLQADYLSSRYDFMGATQILMSAKRVSQSSYEIQRGFAQIEFRKNNLEGAVAYAQKALNLFQGDVDTLVLLSQANLYYAKRLLPNNDAESKKRDEAIKDAMKYALKALEIDGTNVEVNKNYALIMSVTTGVDAGIKILQDLIKKYSFNYEYRVALADLLKNEQRYPESQTIYEQVVDVDPKNKTAFLGLGESYKAQKMIPQALKAYLSAATLDPTDAQPIFEIGKLYLETQRYDEAMKYFERTNKINPNFPRTFYYRGKAAFAAGSFDLALESARTEKKNNPSISDSYILTAEIQHAMKQYNECASEYAQAIKLRAQPASIYVQAAQCYRLGGSTEIAEDMLAIAATRESGLAEIYREQGAIFDTKGDRKASVKAYCLYLELSPNALDKKDIEGRLSRLGFRVEDCNNK